LPLRSCWRASAIRPSHAYTTARMLGKQYMFHLILAATFAPCAVLRLRSCGRTIAIRHDDAYMTARMLRKQYMFYVILAVTFTPFAVEVLLTRHCNSTRPRLHHRQNVWETIYIFHLILAVTFSPCAVLRLRSCGCAIVIRLGNAHPPSF
jgi:D-alanyl-lipoteichoic acid acyltransferase DltB (MBOAT superfamily)